MNQMGNLEKLGILVIVILVVVVGVVAITPQDQVDSALFDGQERRTPVEPLEPLIDSAVDPARSPADGLGARGGDARKDWPLGMHSDVPGTDAGSGAGPANGASAAGPGPGGQSPAGPVAPPAPQFGEYVVQKGDFGTTIAKKTLGRASAWPEIVAANPGLDARKMKPGQKLRIPAAVPATASGSGAAPTPAPPGVTPPALGPVGPAAQPIGPSASAPPTPSAAERVYVVQQGDTLSDIARRELGSASKWQVVRDANADVLRGSETVRTGMKLKIPARSAAVASTPAPASSGAASGAGAKTYKVQSGDTLTSIASRMLGSGSRWREIQRANESVLHGSDRISLGMELTIPDDVAAR